MNKKLVGLLEQARKAATFEDAGFGGLSEEGKDLDAKIKESTRLYRQSWILTPLDQAIAILKRRDDTREKRRQKRKQTK